MTKKTQISACQSCHKPNLQQTLVVSIEDLQLGTYSYTCGQAWIRSCCENIDRKWDGKAGQTSMDEGISG